MAYNILQPSLHML